MIICWSVNIWLFVSFEKTTLSEMWVDHCCAMFNGDSQCNSYFSLDWTFPSAEDPSVTLVLSSIPEKYGNKPGAAEQKQRLLLVGRGTEVDIRSSIKNKDDRYDLTPSLLPPCDMGGPPMVLSFYQHKYQQNFGTFYFFFFTDRYEHHFIYFYAVWCFSGRRVS